VHQNRSATYRFLKPLVGPCLLAGLIALIVSLGVSRNGSDPAPDKRTQSANNLREMALALQVYQLDHNGVFPPAAGGENIHPKLSWRVVILPYIEEEHLYKQFHLNEPWYSPHNRELIERMPKTYEMPGGGDQPGMTRYRVFVGRRAAFELPVVDGPPPLGRRLTDFPAGLNKTAFVAEAADPVPWTKPEELEFAPGQPLPRLCTQFGNTQIVMGDVSVRSIDAGLIESELREFIDRGRDK
jgi:hypothetical protein